MQNKLQELTDRLYNEGLSKGKHNLGIEITALSIKHVDIVDVTIDAENKPSVNVEVSGPFKITNKATAC